MHAKKTCWVVNAGRIAYGPAFELQREIVAARKAGDVPDVLLFCEHPHVITLGRNGARENLLATERVLTQMNVEFHETDRGGDITYHGPGQIVGYPILDLTEHRRDVRWYVEQLEEVMIRTAADYGLAARRVMCRHGIWIDAPERERQEDVRQGTASAVPKEPVTPGVLTPEVRPKRAKPENNAPAAEENSAAVSDEEKLAALGVHLSRWVTSHGFAFNVSTDLRFFDLIVPCGIAGKRATSLERALGRAVSVDEARERLTAHFAEIFVCDIKPVDLQELRRVSSVRAPVATVLAPANG